MWPFTYSVAKTTEKKLKKACLGRICTRKMFLLFLCVYLKREVFVTKPLMRGRLVWVGALFLMKQLQNNSAPSNYNIVPCHGRCQGWISPLNLVWLEYGCFAATLFPLSESCPCWPQQTVCIKKGICWRIFRISPLAWNGLTNVWEVSQHLFFILFLFFIHPLNRHPKPMIHYTIVNQ